MRRAAASNSSSGCTCRAADQIGQAGGVVAVVVGERLHPILPAVVTGRLRRDRFPCRGAAGLTGV